MTHQPSQRVSVIVPVTAGSERLSECLESLLGQSHANKELIVVCGPAEQPLPAEGMEGVRLIRGEAAADTARLINRGMKAARGEIRVVLMPNCVPAGDDWLASLVEPFQDDSVGAVVSRRAVPKERKPGLPARLMHSIVGPASAASCTEPVECELLSHLCDALRADVLGEADGPYDEGLASPAEAVGLSVRIAASGRRIVFNPRATVLCYDPPQERSLRGVFRKALDYGRSDALLGRTYKVHWLGTEVYVAALLSLLLLPVGLVKLPIALILAGALFVWGWFLPLKLPLLHWEWPVALLNLGLYVALVLGMPERWTAAMFDPRHWHPAIVRQWWTLLAVTGSYALLLMRVGARCALRSVLDGAGPARGAAVFLLSMAWHLVSGVGFLRGQFSSRATRPAPEVKASR